MSNVTYVMKRLLHMNYKQMFQKINGIHKKTGKSRLYILKDMQRCANLYGAGYSDYDLYEMYNLTPQQRDTYLTRGRNNALVAKYNDPAYVGIFDDKLQMDVRFKDFLGRDFTTMKTDTDKDQVIAFLKAHDIVIAKPANGMCGHGVEKIEVAKEGGPQKVYEHLKANKSAYVVEEVIVQHPAVSAIYPLAINTCRIVTILKDGEVHVICAYFRIGNKGHHVDNFNSEGMVAPMSFSVRSVISLMIYMAACLACVISACRLSERISEEVTPKALETLSMILSMVTETGSFSLVISLMMSCTCSRVGEEP